MSEFVIVYRKNRYGPNETYTGPGGLICPKCGNGSVHFFDHVKRGHQTQEIHIHCLDCDFQCNISSINIIDPNITKAISSLNRKGYKTRFSCEGHPDDTKYGGTAYIEFVDASLKQIVKEHPLPSPWFLGVGGFDIYRFVIRAHEVDCQKEDWDERCERITEWADSLPVISDDTTFKYGYGFVD